MVATDADAGGGLQEDTVALSSNLPEQFFTRYHVPMKKKFLQENVNVSRLKGLTVHAENDLYDLACLYLRIERDRGSQRVVSGNTVSVSYLTIHGLCSKFDNLVGADPDRVETVAERAGIPLGGSLVED